MSHHTDRHWKVKKAVAQQLEPEVEMQTEELLKTSKQSVVVNHQKLYLLSCLSQLEQMRRKKNEKLNRHRK